MIEPVRRARYRTVVALGSSFAAGPGISPLGDRAAGRSCENVAHIVSRSLGARLIDSTVSGATTATILHDVHWLGVRRFAPQIDTVPPDADLILVTAAGNDLNYIGSLFRRARANSLMRRRITRWLGRALIRRSPLIELDLKQIELATAGLEGIVVECRRRAPNARVVLVDYLPIFDANSTPGPELPFSAAEIDHFVAVAAQLSGAFAAAALRTKANLVPASIYQPGHAAGSSEPFTLGFEKRKGDGVFFHPTRAGMRAAAAEVLAILRSPAD